MPEIGDKAPGFTLPSTHGEVSLQDFLKDGKVILAFYIEDGTPG